MPHIPAPKIDHYDKVIHLLVFGLLATAIYRAFPTHYPVRVRLYWAVGITVLFGLSDELHQGFTPGRTMDPWDWVADTMGALLATTLYAYAPLYRQILDWRPLACSAALIRSLSKSSPAMSKS